MTAPPNVLQRCARSRTAQKRLQPVIIRALAVWATGRGDSTFVENEKRLKMAREATSYGRLLFINMQAARIFLPYRQK